MAGRSDEECEDGTQHDEDGDACDGPVVVVGFDLHVRTTNEPFIRFRRRERDRVEPMSAAVVDASEGNQRRVAMRMKWIVLALCAGLSLSGGVAIADKSAGDQAQTQHDDGDRQFLDTALGVNQLELQLGQLAAQRATTAEVKAMGEKMVQKHTELGQQLAELSRAAGGSGMAALSSEQRAVYDRVASRSGSELDAVFKEVVDAGHIKELAMYEEEVSRAKSPALRELVQGRVAKLRETIAQAQAPKAKPEPKQEPKQEW